MKSHSNPAVIHQAGHFCFDHMTWAREGGTLAGTITDAGGTVRQVTFSAREPGRFEGTLQVPVDALWTAEMPVRHSLHLALMRGGKAVHEIQSKVALREVRVDGPRLLVNGRRIKLRGVNHHDIWPDTGRSATAGKIRNEPPECRSRPVR